MLFVNYWSEKCSWCRQGVWKKKQDAFCSMEETKSLSVIYRSFNLVLMADICKLYFSSNSGAENFPWIVSFKKNQVSRICCITLPYFPYKIRGINNYSNFVIQQINPRIQGNISTVVSPVNGLISFQCRCLGQRALKIVVCLICYRSSAVHICSVDWCLRKPLSVDAVHLVREWCGSQVPKPRLSSDSPIMHL